MTQFVPSIANHHLSRFGRLMSACLLALAVLLLVLLWLAGGITPLRAAGHHYVAPDGVDSPDCTRTDPCRTIQRAIDNASNGDEIRVAAGTYTDITYRDSLTQAVYLNESVTLRGGFTTTNWLTPDPEQNPTIIDAQGQGRVIYIPDEVDTAIIGFHLTGGSFNGDGAGVYNVSGNLMLEDNLIYNNDSGNGAGAGVANGISGVDRGSLVMRNNRVYSNVTTFGGGGLTVFSGTARVEGSQIFGNSAGPGGGGVLIFDGSITLTNNLLYNNVGTGSGGGVYVQAGTVTLLNNTLYDNAATNNGGGIYAEGGTTHITNTLIVSNTAAGSGGLYGDSDTASVSYTDFWGNQPDQGYITGTQNYTDRNPVFVDPQNYDLHLSSGSDAIDSAHSDVAPALDYEGNSRPFGEGIDRGADEYTPPSPCYARLDQGRVYTGVQEAVDAAALGSLVQVAGHCTHLEARGGLSQVVYISESLTLRGGFTVTDWLDPDYGPTLLDAQGLARVVYITSTDLISTQIEGLHIVSGSADYGGGVFLGPNVTATLRNNVLAWNEVTLDGGAIYNQGGNLQLQHNTVYSNTAGQWGGGVFAYGLPSHQTTLENNSVVDNHATISGGGIYAETGDLTLDYNNFYGNTADDYGNVSPGPNDISVAPGFVDPAQGDFHLTLASEQINRANPVSSVPFDFEGQSRPQGLRSDIGADESLLYVDVSISEDPLNPRVYTDTELLRGTYVTFTHTITNASHTGVPTDTFVIESSNSDGWDYELVGVTSPLILEERESVTFDLVVSVPVTIPNSVHNRSPITVTAQSNAAASDQVLDVIVTAGLDLAPSYEREADPGEVVTYTHALTNTGITTDTVTLSIETPLGWGELIEPQPTHESEYTATAVITVGAGLTTPVVLRVNVPETAAANLEDATTARASSSLSENIFDIVTDTTTVNAVTGDRYVALSGDDTHNNCTQEDQPCATIAYAVNQAVWGDTIMVAQGIYDEAGIAINQYVNLQGGYNYNGDSFSLPGGGVDPATTSIDAQNNERILRIQVPSGFHPVISGFTFRNGATSGVGGAVYVKAGSAPTLTNLIILDSSASRGGAIYFNDGNGVVENTIISGTAASGEGGALYVRDGDVLILNTAITQTTASQGGAAYLENGALTIVGGSIYGTSADSGGGVYQEDGQLTVQATSIDASEATGDGGGGIYQLGGTMTISQTQLSGSVAPIGAGLYSADGQLRLWNSMVFSNTATEGGGAGVYNDAGSVELINNTLYANQAATYGGGLFDEGSSSLVVSNTIIVSNTAQTGGGIYYDGTGATSLNYNDVWGNTAPSFPGSNIFIGAQSISEDPLFEGAAGGDLHLTPDSPCVDVGDPNTFLQSDFEDDARPINQGFDIGADELGGCLVRIERTGEVYNVVQEAIDAAEESDVLQISGICLGAQTRQVGDRSLTQAALITQSLTLEGGYTSDFGNDPDTDPITTTLDAQGLGRVVVVTGTDSMFVRIRNLTLTGGSADGMGGASGGGDAGGGLYSSAQTVEVEGVTISNSQAEHGGGVYVADGDFTLSTSQGLSNTLVLSNTATFGGGIYLAGGEPIIERTTLQGNVASGQGGGLYNAAPTVIISETALYSNTANTGGGFYNADGSVNGLLLDIASNDATVGAGLYNTSSAQLDLQRSLLVSNTAGIDGGGIYNAGSLSASNEILAFNLAQSGHGGGLYNRSVDLNLRHSTFYANQASDRGGGAYHDASASAVNSTLVVENEANDGGGVYVAVGAALTFNYNDVVNNVGGDYGGASVSGANNISVDPQFISTAPLSDDFLRLPSGSPAEDAGDPASPVVTDIEGDPRPTNRGFDIGADEVGGCYVRINGDAPTYGNLQVAVGQASPSDTLHVAGTCQGVNTASPDGETISQTVFLTQSLTVRGGYTVTNWSESYPITQPTVLDAMGLGRVIYVDDPAVVLLEGLHLRQGHDDDQGGAIFAAGGTLTVTKSWVYSNTADHGGVLYNQGGEVVLYRENEIYSNTATLGGVVYNEDGHSTLDGSVLRANQATDGGAFYHAGGSGTIQNTIFQENQATGNGGAVYNSSGAITLTVQHNTFYLNSAASGGGFYTQNGDPTLVSNIFLENAASVDGRAIYAESPYQPDYNDVYPAADAYGDGASPGPHSLSRDPLFVNAPSGDFHLRDSSPVIDAGDPNMTLLHDFEGDLRPGDQGFDMGADERAACWAKIVRTEQVYGNIQWAIGDSIPGDEILVTIGECRGVHGYDDGGDIISQTVHITHDLTLRGGFSRDFESGGDSGPQTYPDPAATTLDPLGAGRAILVTDGVAVTMTRFILVNGDAAGLGGGPGGGDAGGLFYHDGSFGHLEHVDFYSGTAEYGGAMFSAGDAATEMTMYNSWINFNTATLDGGAIYNASGSLTMTIDTADEGTRLYANVAGDHGGAIFNDAGSVWLVDNNLKLDPIAEITLNQADQGGLVYNQSGTVYLRNNSIFGNSAEQGGALYNDSGEMVLESNGIYENTATIGGGGVFNDSGDLTLDLGNRLYDNYSDGDGGAIYNSGVLTAWNTLIYTNTAFDQGGGILISGGTSSILHNTFYQNRTDAPTGRGGAIYIASGSATIWNNIFDSNDADGGGSAIYGSSGDLDANDYWPLTGSSQVEGGIAVGDNALNLDPVFEEPAAGDFHLDESSDLIDHPQVSDLGVGRDFEGDPRPINTAPEPGADEYSSCLARVESTGEVYGRIATALENAASGDEIRVAQGLCMEHLDIDDDVTISGSWRPDFTEQVKDDEGNVIVCTTVDADTQDRVVQILPSVTDITLSHIEFTNGDTSGDGGGIHSQADQLNLIDTVVSYNQAADGGGIYIESGEATLDGPNVWFNSATGSGGGIYINDGLENIQIIETFISSNQALGGDGGGAYVGANSQVQFSYGGISFNSASGTGGGLYNGPNSQVEMSAGSAVADNEAPVGGGVYNDGGVTFSVYQKQFNNNEATNGPGGGIYARDSDLELINLGLYGNTALSGDGAGLYRDGGGEAVIYHATIRQNDAGANRGGGLYNLSGSMVISASIIASNSASGGGGGVYNSGGSVEVAHTLRWENDYVGCSPVSHELYADPRVRTVNGDLYFNSPAIDAVPLSASGVPIDRVADPRPQICDVDMGRDEYAVGKREMTWVDDGPEPTEAVVAPGSSFTYTFRLRNDSENYTRLSDPQTTRGPGTGYTETVTVTLSSTQGWTEIIGIIGAGRVNIQPGGQTASFDLGPGSTAQILVRADIPEDAFASLPDEENTRDFTSLTYQARQCPGASALSETSEAAETWVETIREFTVAPDRFGAALPGQTLAYTHTVTNLGNITDTYEIIPNVGYYASGEVAVPSSYELTLTPHQTGTVVISVTINSEIAGGLTDVTNVIARSGEIERSATDRTTISYTTGTRYVSLDGYDSLVDETEGNPDPEAVNYADNNCTQPDVEACRTLRQAIAQAAPDDEIRIAQGIYTETYTTTHAGGVVTQTAFVSQPQSIRGGYVTDGWDADPPDHVAHPTILDPQGQGRAICLTDGITVTIERLTLRGGNAVGLGGGPSDEDAGGILYNQGADLTLSASRIYSGSAELGGGLYSHSGSLTLENALLHTNQATDRGGALYVHDGTVLLQNDTFFGNEAVNQEGGAIYVSSGNLTVINSIVVSNTSAISGAVHAASATGAGAYNLFHGNTVTDTSGLMPPPSSPDDVLAAPQFIDPSVDPPDLYIEATSPARDVGDPSTPLTTDYANHPRPLGAGFDIGAYERVPLVALLFYSDTLTSTSAAETFVFTHTLENHGDVTDTFTISATSTYPWPMTFEQSLPYTVTLPSIIQGSGYTRTVPLTVTAPPEAQGQTNVVRVTAVSENSPDVSGFVEDTIAFLTSEWEIDKVVEPPTTVQPGERLTYTLTVTNTGDLASSGVYTISDPLPAHTQFAWGDPWPDTTQPTVTWTLADPVSRDDSITVSFSVTVTQPLTDGIEIVNDSYSVRGGGAYNQPSGAPVAVTVDGPADLSVSKSASHDPVEPGQWLTYTLTVSNDPAALSPALGVVVTDALPAEAVYQSMGFVAPAMGTIDDGGTPLVWELDDPVPVGGTVGLTVTTRITSPLAPETVLSNTFGVTADNLPTPVSDVLTTAVDASSAITLTKEVEPPTVSTSDTVTYTVTLTNTGTGVAAVTLTDALGPDFDPSLYQTDLSVPGRSWDTTEGVATVVFTATAPASPGIYHNQSVTAAYGLSETGIQDVAPVTVVEPSVEVSKAADPDPVRAGETLTYTLRVTNTCSVDLHATIRDLPPNDVTPSEEQTWSATIEPGVPWEQVLPVVVDVGYSGPLTNVVQVTTTEGATDVYTLTTTAYSASITVTKEANVDGATVGETITYTYGVTNTGSVTLTDVVAHDDRLGPITLSTSELGPQEGATGTATDTVELDDLPGPLVNTVVVTGTPSLGDPVTATASVSLPSEPGVEITKGPDTQTILANGTATFTIAVTNTGGAELSSVEITDDLAPDCDRSFSDLTPGDSETYTCTRANVTASFTNTAVVTGTAVGESVIDEDSASVDVINPAIDIAKTPDSQLVREGDAVSFTIAVTNTGDVTLDSVTVTDAQAPNCDRTFGSLAPGAHQTYTCTLENAQTDFTNEAVVTGTLAGWPDVTHSDDAYVNVIYPDLTIVKTPDSQTVPLNATVAFTITVENMGDVALDSVAVADAQTPSCDRAIGTLSPGEQLVYTCTLENAQTDFTNEAVVTGTPPAGSDVTDSDDATVDVIAAEVDISKTPDLQVVREGDPITFTIAVTNTGDADLEDVTVTDAQVPDCDASLGSLAIGAHEVYTCTTVVGTESMTNTAVVTGTAAGADVTDSDSALVQVIHPAITITKTPDVQVVQGGTTATFAITVTNDGDVDLGSILITDAQASNCDRFFGSLEADASRSYTCTVAAGSVSFTNTVNVLATPPVGSNVTDSDDAFVEVIHPAIQIDKAPLSQTVQVGDQAIFTITVENTGDVALDSVTVNDAQAPGCDASFASLGIGAQQIYTCTFENAQTDFTNTAVVTASPPAGSDVTDSDDADVDVVVAEIDIAKTPDLQVVREGDTVTFTIAVTNTGDYALEDVTVTDAQAPGCGASLGSLAIGAHRTYTCTATAGTDSITNTAVVTGSLLAGSTVTDTDSALVQVIHPAIAIAKTPDLQVVREGDTVTFTITVTNTGDVDLDGVEVVDAQAPDCDRMIGALVAGAHQSYTCSVIAGSAGFTNQAVVTGTPSVGPDVTADDDATVQVIHPAIQIDKAPPNQTVQVGDQAVFTVTIENTGDAALSGVTAVDLQAPDCDASFATLTPGEVQSYTCGVTAPDSDFTNQIAVTGTPAAGPVVTDTGSAAVNVIHPDVAIAKTPDLQVVRAGEPVTFTITVTNTGDYPLDNVMVTDAQAPDCDRALGGLNVGEHTSYNCTRSGVITDFINVAQVTGDPTVGGVVSHTDTAEVLVGEYINELQVTNDSPTELGGFTRLTATVDAGSNVIYTWDFGDGTSGSGGTVDHAYPARGTYTAVVTASNRFNAVTATTPVTIYLDAGADLRVVDMWHEPSSVSAGQPFTVFVSVENQGALETTLWNNPDDHWFTVEIYARESGSATPPTGPYDHAGGSAGDRWDFVGFMPGLLPGESDVGTLNITLSAGGTYSLYAQVDVSWDGGAPPWGMPFGVIPEMDESNNIFAYDQAIELESHDIFLPLVLRNYTD